MPESAEAFDRLVATRQRLNEITRKLNEAGPQMAAPGAAMGMKEAELRYRQLQSEWDEAFRDFESATNAFAATVMKLRPPFSEKS